MKHLHLLTPATLLLLAACGIAFDNRPENHWIGPLIATGNAGQCPPTKATLSLRDGIVTFAPDEGTWVLTGTAGPATLEATQSRQTSDHKLYKTELQAKWTEAAVHGTYTTPQCTYRVDLTSY